MVKRPIRRVPLACIQCRSRKVKCDGNLPDCTRCLADGKACEYQKSRRGGRPRRPVTALWQKDLHQTPWMRRQSTPQPSETYAMTFETSPIRSNSTGLGMIGDLLHNTANICDPAPQTDNITLGVTNLTRTQIDQLLSQYYRFFHTAHPCVVPRWSLRMYTGSQSDVAEIVLPVLLYIGSIFTDTINSDDLSVSIRYIAASERSKAGPKSPYYLQALLLYAIAVYASDEQERGMELLDEVIDGALSIGMQRAEFAFQHSQGDSVLEESWRRTWWQIYITETHMAGSTHSFPTKTGAIPITAHLPCEEWQYESGDIPSPATLRSYGMREFSDIKFSSFAQLVGFTQGVNQALATRRMGDIENAKATAARTDTILTAWCSLLPASKRKLLRDDGSVDELLFKANILMHTYMVDVHRQLSTLDYFPIESVSKCVPPAPPSCNDTIKDEAHIHTAKVLLSVEKLNSLLTLPTRFSEHTPFIICMITLMTIAQLSACRYMYKEPKLSLEREKIRLSMGVLKMMGEVWPSGAREYHTMGIIAREILGLEDEEVHVPQPSSIMSLDALDFNFDIDIDWRGALVGDGSTLDCTADLSDIRVA